MAPRSAEFAKEAMAQQRVPGGDMEGFLDVRWANQDPNPRAQAREKRAHADTYCQVRSARLPCHLHCPPVLLLCALVLSRCIVR